MLESHNITTQPTQSVSPDRNFNVPLQPPTASAPTSGQGYIIVVLYSPIKASCSRFHYGICATRTGDCLSDGKKAISVCLRRSLRCHCGFTSQHYNRTKAYDRSGTGTTLAFVNPNHSKLTLPNDPPTIALAANYATRRKMAKRRDARSVVASATKLQQSTTDEPD